MRKKKQSVESTNPCNKIFKTWASGCASTVSIWSTVTCADPDFVSLGAVHIVSPSLFFFFSLPLSLSPPSSPFSAHSHVSFLFFFPSKQARNFFPGAAQSQVGESKASKTPL